MQNFMSWWTGWQRCASRCWTIDWLCSNAHLSFVLLSNITAMSSPFLCYFGDIPVMPISLLYHWVIFSAMSFMHSWLIFQECAFLCCSVGWYNRNVYFYVALLGDITAMRFSFSTVGWYYNNVYLVIAKLGDISAIVFLFFFTFGW